LIWVDKDQLASSVGNARRRIEEDSHPPDIDEIKMGQVEVEVASAVEEPLDGGLEHGVLGHIDAANQPEANRLGQLDDLERGPVVKGLCHRAH
jgi:hypothetical protein